MKAQVMQDFRLWLYSVLLALYNAKDKRIPAACWRLRFQSRKALTFLLSSYAKSHLWEPVRPSLIPNPTSVNHESGLFIFYSIIASTFLHLDRPGNLCQLTQHKAGEWASFETKLRQSWLNPGFVCAAGTAGTCLLCLITIPAFATCEPDVRPLESRTFYQLWSE